jgi:regulator of replication initiation timing
MSDIIDIISSAVSNICKLKEMKTVSGDSGIDEIFSGLERDLNDVKLKAVQLENENLIMKNEIRQLRIRLGEEKEFDIKNNVLYTPEGDGPFCPFCYEKRGKMTRLRQDFSEKDSTVTYACRLCGWSLG